MNLTKSAVLFLFAMSLLACSGNKKEDPIPRPPKRDPIIEQEAKKNQRLYNQTEAEMMESLKLPDITYEFDSIRPPEYAYAFLDKVANIMKANPHLRLIIEGHTDIIGGEEYNYWLSGSRAAAMKSYIVSRGVLADTMRIHSHGKERPLTYDTSDEGRITNRRVSFIFTTRNWNSVY